MSGIKALGALALPANTFYALKMGTPLFIGGIAILFILMLKRSKFENDINQIIRD